MGSERAPKAGFRGAGVAPVQKEPGTEKRSHVENAPAAPPARSLAAWQSGAHPPHPVPLRNFTLSPVVAEKAQRWSVMFPKGFPVVTSAGS